MSKVETKVCLSLKGSTSMMGRERTIAVEDDVSRLFQKIPHVVILLLGSDKGVLGE